MARTIRHGGARDGKLPDWTERGTGRRGAGRQFDNYLRTVPGTRALRASGPEVGEGRDDERMTRHERSRVRRIADRAAVAEQMAEATE